MPVLFLFLCKLEMLTLDVIDIFAILGLCVMMKRSKYVVDPSRVNLNS